MHQFSDKKPTETVTIVFDFASHLGAGEGISSASVNVMALSGTDASPNALLSGAAVTSGSVVSQKITGGVNGVTYAISVTIQTQSGLVFTESGLLSVVDSLGMRSALFVRDIVITSIRKSALALAAASHEQVASINAVDDDALWLKIKAAEADARGVLGIPLQPTEIFIEQPTQAEIDALNGKPYLVEPGYDLPPNFFAPGQFGTFRLRQKPVIAIHELKLIYPNQGGAVFTIPPDWIRLDNKNGDVRLFPSALSVTAPISLMTMQAISAGYTIPHMIRAHYTAGLTDTNPLYYAVVDVVKRMSVLKLLQDSFTPQSGSISVDGMSQSVSADVAKFQGDIDTALEKLKLQLAGPVWDVL
jgi:hypothetical protein